MWKVCPVLQNWRMFNLSLDDFVKKGIFPALQSMSDVYFQTVEAGALPLFVKMMNYKEEDEQEAAAKTTWTLAFDKEVIRITFAQLFYEQLILLLTCQGYFTFDTNSLKISILGTRKY